MRQKNYGKTFGQFIYYTYLCSRKSKIYHKNKLIVAKENEQKTWENSQMPSGSKTKLILSL